MHMRFSLGVLALMLASCAGGALGPMSPNAEGVPFNTFYEALKREAGAKGLNAALLDEAYGGKPPAPMQAIEKAESAQPEFTTTFESYTGAMLSGARIATARRMMENHRADLARVEAKTGVPAGLMVALWGIESGYGKAQGTHPLLPALVTLAWQSPRHDYFKKEVFATLTLLNKTKRNPATLLGSWAGATGQCQFMPSNILAHGKDGNGDGVVDIWNTPADVFASTADLIKANGYKPRTPWRLPLKQPVTDALHLNVRGLSAPHTLAEWQTHGLKVMPKGFKKSDVFRVYQPTPGGPAFLMGPNFEAVLRWNKSSYFAYSVLALSDVLPPVTQP